MKQIYFPITRSFDGKDGHYVYGELPFEPDSLGTMLSRDLVENNLERLKKFPSARFMHKEPVGKIDFENSINGYRTHVDENSFHVLIKIFDVCEKEFNIIREGSYGLSYGLIPTKTEHRRVNGKDVEVFTEGTLYEVSIVDSPALDSPLTIVRSTNKITKVTKIFDGQNLYSAKIEHPSRLEPERKFTTIGYDVYEICEDGSLKVPESKESVKRSTEEEWRKQKFPDVCSSDCENVQCPYRRHENYGKPCLLKFEQYKNRSLTETI